MSQDNEYSSYTTEFNNNNNQKYRLNHSSLNYQNFSNRNISRNSKEDDIFDIEKPSEELFLCTRGISLNEPNVVLKEINTMKNFYDHKKQKKSYL